MGANPQKQTKNGESMLEIDIKQGSYECGHAILEARVIIEHYHITVATEVK